MYYEGQPNYAQLGALRSVPTRASQQENAPFSLKNILVVLLI